MVSHETVDEVRLNKAQSELVENACKPFDNPQFRQLLKEIKQRSDIVIDEITTDQIINASYDLAQAEERITSFMRFMEENKDELLALQILYNQPYRKSKLTYSAIKELIQKLSDPPYHLTTADVWQAYKRLSANKVRGAPVDRQLTEIIALVRFTLGQDDVLEPFGVKVEQRFNLWIGRQKKAGRDFSEQQLRWLRLIAQTIAANLEVRLSDFQELPLFSDEGGIVRGRALFGVNLDELVNELQTVLVA